MHTLWNLMIISAHFQPRTCCPIRRGPLFIRANMLLSLGQIGSARQCRGPPLARKWYDLFFFSLLCWDWGWCFFFLIIFLFFSGLQKERSTVKHLVFQMKCCGTEGWSVWLSLIASILIDQSVVLRPESFSLLSFLSATASRLWCHKGGKKPALLRWVTKLR